MSKVNSKLLSQALRVFEDRAHKGLAKSKTRGEVSISTRKIYKQKGTGGARHGAKSAPIFVGGGTAHGPHGIKRILTLPKKMAHKALLEAFKLKSEEGKLFIDNKLIQMTKTKEAKALLDKLMGSKDWKGKVLVIIGKKDQLAGRAFRNLKNVSVLPAQGASVLDVFKSGAVLLDTDSAESYKLTPVKKAVVTKTAKSKAVKTKK
jgi:large subunit ribosomal protein L4